jgi:DNA primase catalytic subunit
MEPPSKRQKTTAQDDSENLDDEEYEQVVTQLQLEWKKGRKGRSQTLIKQLMEKTSITRRQWITDEKPLVADVLSKFPMLKQSRMVRVINYRSL